MARPTDPAAEIERVLAGFRARAEAITLDRSDLETPYADPGRSVEAPADGTAEPAPPAANIFPDGAGDARPPVTEPGDPRSGSARKWSEPGRAETASTEPPTDAWISSGADAGSEPEEEAPPPVAARESLLPRSVRPPPSVAPASDHAPASRRHSRGRPAIAGAALIGAATIALAGRAWLAADAKAVHRSFPLPFTATSALAAEGSTLFTVDPRRGLLFTLAASRDAVTVTSIQKFPNPSPDGLAFGEGRLWSSASSQGRIARHSAAAPFGVETAFTNPDSRPADLAWDGKRLWSLDRRTNTVSQNSAGASLFPMAQHTLPAIEPAGLHAGDGLLWVFDRGTRRVLRYRAGGVLAPEDFLDLGPWLPANSRVTGMAVEGGFLWLAAENPAELHRFDLTRALKRAGKGHHPVP